MRARLLVGAVGAALITAAAWGCSSSPNPVAPKPGGEGGGGTITRISIMASEGDQTFSPSPTSAAQGSQISWVNTDSEVHHIVATDGSFDIGELAPGGTSTPIVLGTNSAQYYCTLHPSEVGSINSR